MVKYNTEQKLAIGHNDGPVMVVAGAGTGKTAVITARIARLIKERKAKPSEILALTFTDKASAQMQDRLDELLDYGYSDCEILTFHSLGDTILREHAVEIGLASDYTILSEFSQAVFMQEILNALPLSYHKPLGNPYSFVMALISFISRLKDEDISAMAFSKFAKLSAKKAQSSEEKLEAERIGELDMIYSEYQKRCREQSFLDYGDLITAVLEIFYKRPQIAKLYQEKYRYVLVDEYQDTNYSQNKLINMLSKKHQNIMVVGDDDQSIYRFRGAAVENILGFNTDYPQAKQIVLRHNYRSTTEILDAAYRLIQNNNPYRLEAEHGLNKKLLSEKQGEPVGVDFAETLSVEMENIALQLKKYHKAGIEYRDMAVLMRKNSQASAIELALSAQGIPYRTAESQKLFEQPEIRVLLNFIEALSDPAASRAVYALLVGDLYALPMEEIAQHSSAALRLNQPLEAYLRQQDTPHSIVIDLLGQIDSYRQASETATAGQQLYTFIEKTGYLARLVRESEQDSRAAQKVHNISLFFGLVREFEKVSIDPTMFALYQHLYGLRHTEADIVAQSSVLDTNAVNITTVHKSKGLEYEVVFILDLVEQTFPAKRSSQKSIRIPEGLLSSSDESIDWHLSEERRLFYVAMTRAKQSLHLSCSFDHGGKRALKPSRFISESIDATPNPSEAPSSGSIQLIQSFAPTPRIEYDPLAQYLRDDGWLHLSTGQVATYLRSPKEFWYFDILKLPKGPFHALVYGSAIHAAIETYYRAVLAGKKITVTDLLKVFEHSWDSEGFVSLQHEQDRFQAGKKVLQQFYLDQQKSSDRPVYVEKEFTLRLDQCKLAIRGRYDAVYIRDGKVEIRDFKTGQVDDEKAAKNRLRDSIQLQIYALAWEKNSEQVVDEISLHFVEPNIIVSNTKIDHAKTMKKLKSVADGIRAHEFQSRGSSMENFERLL